MLTTDQLTIISNDKLAEAMRVLLQTLSSDSSSHQMEESLTNAQTALDEYDEVFG